VVNHDEAEGKTLTRLVDPGTQVLTYGTNGATELQGSILGMDSTGMNLNIASPWGGGNVRTGLLGRRNLSNLLAAAGTLALMGMPWDKVMHQIEIMSAEPGKMNCLAGELGQPAAVIDGARTPEELEDVLLTLRSHLHGRLVCVLADIDQENRCLGEPAANRRSGESRESALQGRLGATEETAGCRPHSRLSPLQRVSWQAEMVRVAELLSDQVITASRANRRDAIRRALRDCGPGDIVLIAGMGLGDWQRHGEAAVRDLLEEAA
jgi:UDP-N-acetylmuramoyl-L-alanyl-D-glutamate--2,6-diaminopimelate ligase